MNIQHHFAKYIGKPIWNSETEQQVKLTGIRVDNLLFLNGTPEEQEGLYPNFKILVKSTEEVIDNKLPLGLAVIEVERSVVKKAIPMTPEFFLENLQEKVHRIANVTAMDMYDNRHVRLRIYKEPRQIIMAVWAQTFKNKGVTLSTAGKVYDKDHATALHARKTVNNLLDTDKVFREKYAEVWQYAISVTPKIELNI
jgi:hypothetical protein